MPGRAAVYTLFVLVLLLAPGSAAHSEGAGRVALVVGNSDYTHVGRLPNPANDATDVSAALRRLGFEVTTVRDVGRAAFTTALADFTDRSIGADIALVFYAGHGMEMDGVNYLVPVDARLERDTRVRFETLTLDDVLLSTEGAALRLVILDACRNNPLASSMRRTVRTRSISNGSFGDLDEAWLEGGETLVAYAAAARTTADDGTGRNSPYTAALLEHLEQPLELLTLFRRVRGAVLSATDGRQRPHEYQSLLGEHYLTATSRPGASSSGVATAGAAGSPGTVAMEQETLFWESIQQTRTRADFEAFLRQFPNGTFAGLARNRLAALRSAAVERPAPDPPRPDPVRPRPWQAGETFRDCPTCPELVVLPAGTFRMGCVSGLGCVNDELPVREIEVASFALSRYEVTFKEYERFATATGRRQPSDWGWGGGRRPVTGISWEDAVAYVDWLSDETGERYRLPSETEWEYAARAGTRTAYSWGQNIGRNRANCDGCGSRWDDDEAAPVGSFAANAWGLHDMHGNVSEWVADCWRENYALAPVAGSAWRSRGSCDRRVLRGGSWLGDPVHLRSAKRGRMDIGLRYAYVGFRVVRNAGF